MKRVGILVVLFVSLVAFSCISNSNENSKTLNNSQWCGTSEYGEELLLSFISDTKCILEYIDDDIYSEEGSYVWNSQLEKGTVTIDDDSYTITKDNANKILILNDGKMRIFSSVRKNSNTTINLSNSIWLGFENGDLIKIQFGNDNSFLMHNITVSGYEDTIGKYQWNATVKKGIVSIGRDLEIALSKSGNLLMINVQQFDGSIYSFGYIRIK